MRDSSTPRPSVPYNGAQELERDLGCRSSDSKAITLTVIFAVYVFALMASLLTVALTTLAGWVPAGQAYGRGRRC